MKVGWEAQPLGNVCEILNGSTPSKSNSSFWNNGTISWFTIDDIREQGRIITHTRKKITEAALDQTSVKLLPPESILLCCTASVGEYAITKIPLTTNQQFNGFVIKDPSRLDPNFLFHFASTLKSQLLSLSGKATIDFIPISRVRDVAIPIPPLPEQQRLVRILDETFDCIATANANVEKNLLNVRALFKSYLDKVFSQRNEGWQTKRLGEVCVVDKLQGIYEDLPFVGLEHIEAHTGRFIGATEPVKVKSSTFKFSPEHLLYGRLRPYLNKVMLPDFIGHCSTEIFPLKPLPDLLREFLQYWFLMDATVEQIDATSTGARMPRANMNEVLNFEFPLPSVLEQHDIVTKLNVLRIEAQHLESLYQNKLAALDELKKSLLHQVFTGEL